MYQNQRVSAHQTDHRPLISAARLWTGLLLLCLLLALCLSASAAKLTLPSGTKVIEAEAFYGASSLDEVVLPEGLEQIGPSAFANSSVKSVTLPQSLKTIGARAFANSGLKGPLVIPSSVTSIGTDAFAGCSSLFQVGIKQTQPDGSVTTVARYAVFCAPGSYAWQWAESNGFAPFALGSDLAYGVLEYTYPAIVGLEFDLNIRDKLPANAPVTYASSDSSVLSVSADGHVRVLAPGKADLTVVSGANTFSIPYRVPDVFSILTLDTSNEDVEDYVLKPKGCTEILTTLPRYYGPMGGSEEEIARHRYVTYMVFNGVGEWQAELLTGSDFVTLNMTSGTQRYVTASELYTLAEPSSTPRIAKLRFTMGDYSCTAHICHPGDLPYIFSILPDDTVRIDKYTAYSAADLTIPSQIADTPVTMIAENAFQYQSSLTGSLTIPDTVTSIGACAFDGCTGLDGTLTLPASLTDVGENAFRGCSSLAGIVYNGTQDDWENVNISDGNDILDTVEPGAIKYSGTWGALQWTLSESGTLNISGQGSMNNLTFGSKDAWLAYQLSICSVVIHDGVESIGDYAFSYCKSLTNISIPDSVTSIGNNAFQYCTSMTTISIPDNVTTIGDNTFSHCTGLTSIYIPDGVTCIGQHAFSSCSRLTSFYIPNSVTSIGNGAFSDCTSLTTISIPDSVTSIGPYAFSYCANLTSILIPDSVTSIGDNTFYKCTNLTYVLIPDSVTAIGNYAFRYCTSLTSIYIPNSVTTIANYAFEYCTSLTNIYIPNSVTRIPYRLFNNCTSLTSIYIPDTVTNIQHETFSNCPLTDIYCVNPSYAWTWFTDNGYADQLREWDGTVTPTIKGSFTEDIMLLPIVGDPQTPAGMVISEGADIYRVTLTLNDYNQDGTNLNRYRTYVFDGMNKTGVTLTDPDWAGSFALDTTQEPFNLPGEYIINLWASLVEGEGVKLDSMTVYVGWTAHLNSSHAAVYADENNTDPAAYLDDYASVFVIGENNNRYRIRTDNGDLWWIDKKFISTDENQLNVSVTAEGTGTAPYAQIQARAQANEGTAPYQYTFVLYRNNTPVLSSGTQTADNCIFDITRDGTYSVLATVTDADGMTGTGFSENINIASQDKVTVSGRVLSDTGSPIASASVVISENETPVCTILTDHTGCWTWNEASIGKTYTVSVSSDNLSFGEPVSFTVEQAWNMVLEPMYANGSGNSIWTQPNALHGLILTESGSPAEAVPVVLTTEHDTAARITWTDMEGKWTFSGLTDGVLYTIAYGGDFVDVEPASHAITFSADSNEVLNAVASSVIGETSNRISFTMQPASIKVHESAAFDITVPADTAAVRLVVDGKPYDVFAAENGKAYLTRVFNKSGNRKVAFQITLDGTTWNEISTEKTLVVTTIGQPLKAPVIQAVAGHTTGSPLTIRWNKVTNAEEYVVYLSRNGEAVDKLQTESLFVELPDYDFALPGSYRALVMATGTGYDQSEASILFDVAAKDYALNVTEQNNCADRAIHEKINVNINQQYGYILLKIETPSGTNWYPGAGALLSDANISHQIDTPEAGLYTVTPYLYTVSPLRSDSVPYMTGKPIQVRVNGPAINTILPGGYDWTWMTEEESAIIGVSTNSGVSTVSVYEGEKLLGTKEYAGEVTANGSRLFTVTLDKTLAEGLHTITVKAFSSDQAADTSKNKQFYVVHTLTQPYTVYAQAESLDIFSSPLLSAKTTNTIATVSGGINVEPLTCIGTAGDYLQVRINPVTYSGLQARAAADIEGFASQNGLAATVWPGASGTLSLIKPGTDLSVPQGTFAQLEVSWNCGVAVPAGAVFEISLTPLVGNTPTKVTTSNQGERISIKTLSEDEYTLQVKLLQGNTVLAASETRKITIGNFSLEEAYRQWWLEHNAANYTEYLKNGAAFEEKVSAWHGWGGFIPLNVRGMRPVIIFEPSTLAYKQMLQDFKDLDKDANVNTDENIHLVYQDETKLRRTALTNIALAMIEEKEAGNLMLQQDMSNVSAVAASNQTISIRESRAQRLFRTIEAITSGCKIAANTYASLQPGPHSEALSEAINKFMDTIEVLMSVVEDTVMSSYEETAVLELLNAYADQYAYLMDAACDAYVTCLENTYLGNDWSTRGTYSSYVKEYIDSFKALRNDPDKLHQIAVDEILKGTGYTYEQLGQLNKQALLEIGSESIDSILWNSIVVVINNSVKLLFNVDTKIVRYNSDKDIPIEFNPEVPRDAMASYLKEIAPKLITEYYKNQLRESIQKNLTSGSAVNGVVIKANEAIKEAKAKMPNAVDKVLAIAFDSWEFGTSMGELIQASSRLNEQGDNKGLFDSYGLNLVLSLKLRQEAYVNAEFRNVNWDLEGSTISIQELEKFRNALVTLTNYDLSILQSYYAMRTINDNNGFKFKYGIDWLTPAWINQRIYTVKVYREEFLERPAVFDSLFH